MTDDQQARGEVAAALEARCGRGGDLSVDSRRATANYYDASPRRLRTWHAIFDEILSGRDVPREGRALVITAGPPGAGKSTTLEQALSAELVHWRRLDPDQIKERLIRQAITDGLYEDLLRQQLPDRRPIMPGELAGLVHQESVQMVADLRRICMARGENVILEGTLSWEPMIDVHIREIASHGYDALDVLVVDVPRATAREQALSRWWTERTDPNTELGGRFVPQAAIDACYSDGHSTCRENAEELQRRAIRLGGLDVRLVQPADVSAAPLRVVGDD